MGCGSPRTAQEYIYYYREVAGIRTAEKYRKEITNSAVKLGRFPFLGSIEENADQENSGTYRSIVVNKYYKIIYQVEKQRIFIAAVWDVRQK